MKVLDLIIFYAPQLFLSLSATILLSIVGVALYRELKAHRELKKVASEFHEVAIEFEELADKLIEWLKI